MLAKVQLKPDAVADLLVIFAESKVGLAQAKVPVHGLSRSQE